MQIGDNNNTPTYGQVNITIPLSTSPQLDSKGSSPRSDYSSHSSTSSKNVQSDTAREKFLSEMRGVTHELSSPPLSQPEPSYSKLEMSKDFEHQSRPNLALPDNLTFANKVQSALITSTENESKTEKPVCCKCDTEIIR